ncbi:SpaH/EbpB family LPXTG-anchored major pilin [Enterococcus sp. JM9B]|uniref:SpaH/EbpB family LPXTG-anchored major pilin n=1 Tax=Enterococcus sp. JM9B TaxID=1857216 RepID=UPI001374E888|nr:SpaH/EbpB family LPXTG-anchored major pilin [Enterococcus sp. JM9B]KAF1304493.1 hypothetical protein BAU16_01905 [Enterococcus sp. JM9B]
MKAKKIFGLLAAGMMALPLLFGAMGAGNVVDAAEVPKDVSVTLHKLAWEDEMPGELPNDGKQMPEFADGWTPLSGVEFTVYDVTAKYHELASATGGTSQGAVNTIVADSTTGKPTYAASIVDGENTDTKGTTGTTGEVKFGNLPLKKMVGGISKDAVYLFIETDAPVEVREKAAPIVLAMPIYTVGDDSTLNTDIHLYPKNVTMEDTKEITTAFETVTVNGETYNNVNIGDTIEYKITVNVPKFVGQLSVFSVEDVPAEGLALNPTSITLSGDLTKDMDYTIDTKDRAGFLIDFDVAKGITGLAGKEITITYSMTLTGDIDPQSIFGNDVSIKIGDKTNEVEGPGIVTGGHKFIKTDAHTGKGLAGAEFVVTNADRSHYAVFEQADSGDYIFAGTWSEFKTAATTITSGTDGVLNIKGFTDGSYYLEETKAPSDKYVLLTEPQHFVVTHGEYGETNVATNVANTPKGLLPSTGGNGIFAFLAIGLGLMLGAFVWYKNSKKQASV